MSVDYDVRNFKTLDQKNRKVDQYMKMLALQSKMNQQYEEAMQDYEDGLKLDVKQVPPERRSVAEEQADVIFQKQTAFTNAKSIMRDDQAQQFVSGIDLGRAVMFNSNFADISKRLEGRKDTLTADFLNEFLNRYATLLASTQQGGVDTGIILPLQEPDFTAGMTNLRTTVGNLPTKAELTAVGNRLTTLYGKITTKQKQKFDDLARLVTTLDVNTSTKLIEKLNEIETNVTDKNAEALKKLLDELPKGKPVIADLAWYFTINNKLKDESPESFAQDYLYQKKAKRANKGDPNVSKLENLVKTYRDNIDKFSTAEHVVQTIRTGQVGKLKDLYQSVRKLIMLTEFEKTEMWLEEKGIRRADLENVRRDFDEVVKDVYPELFVSEGGEGKEGTGLPAPKTYPPPPTNMLGFGMTRVGHTYVMQPKHRRFVGKGIEPAGSTKFKKFGKLIIHIPSLKNGILNIKHPSMSNVKGFPQTYISQNMVDFLLHLLDANEIDSNMWSRLTTEEQELLKRAFVRADLDDVLGIKPKVNEDYRKQLKEFELIRGQVIAGNNNHQLLQQLESYVNSFMKQGMMSARDGNEILKEIQQIV